MIYNAEVTLGKLTDEGFLESLFIDAVAAFGSVEKRGRVAELQKLVDVYMRVLPLPR